MIYESIPQFAIVRLDTASHGEDELNERIRHLVGKNPKVEFYETMAVIRYTETNKIPETIADSAELEGFKFTCQDCPCFDPILKADGTEDNRLRYGECQYADMGRAYKDSAACDTLFKMIKNGRVGLCFRG